MASFIKLSKIFINTNYIRNINILQSKYEIKMASPYIDGFLLFGSGTIDLDYYTINVCEKDNNEDYKILKKWIDIQYHNSQ
jgi:hypothetical protein